MRLFATSGDYEAFERVLLETLELRPMRLLAYCVMPNHWHLVVWPAEDGHLAAFMQRLTITHARRWQEHRHVTGDGHIYQGRYKSFPVETDEHFFRVCRYVERNALRAGLVERAEAWAWSSLWRRERGSRQQRGCLADWPVDRPDDWLLHVNGVESDEELTELRLCVNRGQPFGTPAWTQATVSRLGLESTVRKRGRPAKKPVATG